MSTGNGNGSRLVGLDGGQLGGLPRNAKDDQGRVLRHNATVYEAHQIAIEEGNKMHAFYLNQVPEFVARMVMDALDAHGLLHLRECVSCGAITRASKPSQEDTGAVVTCRCCGSQDPLKPVGIQPLTAVSDAPPVGEATGATPPAAPDPTA